MRHNPRKGLQREPGRPAGPSDPHLLDRLAEYGQNQQLSDIDGALEYLRRNYPEYRRKQTVPFRKYLAMQIPAVRRRIAAQREAEEIRGPRRVDVNPEEDRLREREDAHVLNLNGVGDMNEDLAFEGSDNSSENSDGVESDDTSNSDAEEGDGAGPSGMGVPANRPNARPDNGARGKAKANERSTGAARRRRDRESDSEEEELAYAEMEAAIPSFNIMNASLRATYNGRPVLISEPSPAVTSPAVTYSSSSIRVSPARGKGIEEEREKGECSLAAMGSSNKIGDEDERERPAFAPPSMIAEAARAASALSGRRPLKGPQIEQESKEGGVIEERGPFSRGSPPAQSSGRPPPPIKSSSPLHGSVFHQENGGRQYLSVGVNGKFERSKQNEDIVRDRESIGASQESNLLRKRERESEKVRPVTKKGKWAQDKGGKEGLENGSGGKGGSSAAAVPRNVSFRDLGGIEGILGQIHEVIEYPLAHPELYDWLGVQPPRGVLLHGPPGCGKTMLANAIAVETGVPFLKISAPEVVSGMSGESEAKVRSLFAEAVKVAPCIVFIDEIDAITPKRETAQREMERRIVAQLLTCMDDLSQPLALTDKGANSDSQARNQPGHVVVIGATNRPDSLDPALRRAGRFDREIAMGIPDEDARARILSVLSRKLRLEGSFDFKRIAKRTPGFVGADLAALSKEAAALAVKRIFSTKKIRSPLSLLADPSSLSIPKSEVDTVHRGSVSQLANRRGVVSGDEPSTLALIRGSSLQDKLSIETSSVCGEITGDGGEDVDMWRRPWTREEMEPLAITMQDFEDAVEMVQPSAKREGFATIPDVSWDDVGSLGDVREDLEFSICRAIKYPEEYQALGMDMATGVLLYGPPGCGKTLVAKAIANEAGANFICVKGPELLNKYVGESERAVRQLFTRARASAPCILFFDEMDAMAPRRGSDGNGAAERVVNQLLTEMDGLEQRKSIYLIAATNRPDMIDPALLRPGRLDTLLYVPLPDPAGRASIMRTLVRKTPLGADVDAGAIGESMRCEGFSGADLASLVREACTAALKEKIRKASRTDNLSEAGKGNDEPVSVSAHHFEIALTRVFPSVSTTDRRRYEDLRMKLRRSRGHLKKPESESEGPPPHDTPLHSNGHLVL